MEISGIMAVGLSIPLFIYSIIKLIAIRKEFMVPLYASISVFIVALFFKLGGLIFGVTLFVELFLVLSTIPVALIAAQINRITYHSYKLNFLAALLTVISGFEVFYSSPQNLSPKYTVLPIRNFCMFLLALISFILIIRFKNEIKFMIKHFGDIIEEDIKIINLLVLISAMQVVMQFAFFLTVIFPSTTTIGIMVNYLGILMGSGVLALFSYYFGRRVFYLIISGVKGITLVVNDIVIAKIGNISDSLIYPFTAVDLKNIVYFSDRYMIVVSKFTVDWLKQRKFMVMGIANRRERETELFINYLVNFLEDRIYRDKILLHYLAKLDILEYKKILLDILKEEISYAIDKFAKISFPNKK